MINELAQDISEAIAAMPRGMDGIRLIGLVEQAIRRDSQFLRTHPTRLFQSLWNSCWWYDCPESAGHFTAPVEHATPLLSSWMEQWRSEKEEVTPGFSWLRSLRPPQSALGARRDLVLKKHDDSIRAVVCTPDGRYLASASNDRSIRIWDLSTGEELLSTVLVRGPVSCLDFSPDSSSLAFGCGSIVGIWRFLEHVEPLDYDIPSSDTLQSIKFTSDGNYVIGCQTTGEIVILRADDASLVSNGMNIGSLKACVPIAGGKLFAYGSDENSVCLKRTSDGELLAEMQGHEDDITSIALTNSEDLIASGSFDKTVRLWSLDTIKEVCCLTGHTAWVFCVAFSPDGKLVAAGGTDHSVRVWQIDTKEEVASFTTHRDWVTAITFTAEGRQVVSASKDKEIRVTDIYGSQQQRNIHDHTKLVDDISFSQSGAMAVTSAKHESYAILWKPDTGVPVGAVPNEHGTISAKLSKDQSFLMTSSWDAILRRYDLTAEAPITTFVGHQKVMENLLFNISNDDSLVVSWGDWNDGSLRVWDAQSGEQLFEVSKVYASQVIFSKDSAIVAAALRNRSVGVWNARTGIQVAELQTKENCPMHCISISGSGKIISASQVSDITIWELSTQRTIKTLRADRCVIAMQFSADGKTLFANNENSEMQFWELDGSPMPKTVPGIGDLDAIARGANLVAFVMTETSVIRKMSDLREVAWVPTYATELIGSPSTNIWAGKSGLHTQFFRLEGRVGTPRLTTDSTLNGLVDPLQHIPEFLAERKGDTDWGNRDRELYWWGPCHVRYNAICPKCGDNHATVRVDFVMGKAASIDRPVQRVRLRCCDERCDFGGEDGVLLLSNSSGETEHPNWGIDVVNRYLAMIDAPIKQISVDGLTDGEKPQTISAIPVEYFESDGFDNKLEFMLQALLDMKTQAVDVFTLCGLGDVSSLADRLLRWIAAWRVANEGDEKSVGIHKTISEMEKSMILGFSELEMDFVFATWAGHAEERRSLLAQTQLLIINAKGQLLLRFVRRQ